MVGLATLASVHGRHGRTPEGALTACCDARVVSLSFRAPTPLTEDAHRLRDQKQQMRCRRGRCQLRVDPRRQALGRLSLLPLEPGFD